MKQNYIVIINIFTLSLHFDSSGNNENGFYLEINELILLKSKQTSNQKKKCLKVFQKGVKSPINTYNQ